MTHQPESPKTRKNLGCNSIAPVRSRVSTALLRHYKKSEEKQGVGSSLRTAGLGLLALAWSIGLVITVKYAGAFGAVYGRNIAVTRKQNHNVSIDAAMVTAGSFGVLWIIIAALIAFTITCLVVRCFIPKCTFRISLFGYYQESDGRDLIDTLQGNAIVSMIYAAILVAINFAAMALLTDTVHLFGR